MNGKSFDWNKDKNKILQKSRGVCFEEVVIVLETEGYIDDVAHPNRLDYPNQRVFIIEYKNYIYEIPYVEDGEKIFLKTIFPSRKSKKAYTN